MTRKSLMNAFAVAICVIGAGSTSEARPRPARTTRSFEANKTIGLGLELGAPFGVTGKYFMSSDRALDFGVGNIYNYRDRYGLHLYLDYLFHPFSLASNATFELPLYFGIGGRLWDFEDRRFNYDGVYAFGVRVPAGIAFDFNNVPLDIFIQLVFVLDFYTDYRRDVYGDLNGSIGARYWFK